MQLDCAIEDTVYNMGEGTLGVIGIDSKTKEYNQFANIEWINTNSTVDLLMSRALDRQS